MSDLLSDPFISALPFPTLVIDENQGIEFANTSALEFLGEQILQRHFVSVLRQPKLLAAIEECRVSQIKKVGPYMTTVGHGDVSYDVHIAPIEGRLLLTFIDKSDALDLYKFRHDFVANVSHELRTPLASVIGFIETLRGPAKDDADTQEHFLKIMQSEAERMARLVDDLLSLSRVEENQRKRPTTIVGISDIATQTVNELQPIIAAAGAAVSIVDHCDGCKVLADAGQLRQVIGNLVENALRYGAQLKKIAITITITAPDYETRLRRNGIRLSVCDNGQGIAAHHLPRLTERFYRIDSHRSREDGGTGLGLAIVKHIVQRHRGHLLIESTLEKGSTFTVILPVFEEKQLLS